MPNPRNTVTNAADSAPGVDDGRKGAAAPPVNSKPGARKAVFWVVALSLVVLAIAFFARPFSDRGSDDAMIEAGGTRGEIVASDAPGASQPDVQRPAR